MSRNIFEYHLAFWRKERFQKAYYSVSVRVLSPGLTWLPKAQVTGWLTAKWLGSGESRVQKTKGQRPLSLAQQMPAGFFLVSHGTPEPTSQRHWLSSNPSKGSQSWESPQGAERLQPLVWMQLTPEVCGTHLFQGKGLQELKRGSPVWGKCNKKVRPDSMSSQENDHCLLNYSFSDTVCPDTASSQPQRARNPERAARVWQANMRTLLANSAGWQDASEDTKGDPHLYFFFNHDLSLSALSPAYGQWE